MLKTIDSGNGAHYIYYCFYCKSIDFSLFFIITFFIGNKIIYNKRSIHFYRK